VLLAVNAFPGGLFFLIMKLAGNDVLGKLFMALQDGFRNNSTSDATRSSAHRAQNYTPNSSSRSRAAQTGSQPSGPVVVHEPDQTKNSSSAQQPQSQPHPGPAQHEKQAQAEPQAAQARKKEAENDGIQHISKGKKALFILGWVLLGAGILGTIYGIAGSGVLWKILQWIAVALGGGGMLVAARSKDRKERLYQNIVKLIGEKAYVDLKALSSAAGIKQKTLIRELDEMVERGYLPATAYLDNARGLLIIDQVKAEDQIVTDAVEETQREEDKYDLLLKEMERACGRIQDRDMLEKAVQIRGLAAAIFNAVRNAPEKQPQISSFLNYYFPTTLKLLDSYADFEEKGFQGDKLSQTKERIEATMDTIISAYRKQLDNLYLSDTLDVDTDIDVLETMIKRDGLSESDFSSGDQEGTPGTMN
jgi:DNA mismatch repair ATPase MutL